MAGQTVTSKRYTAPPKRDVTMGDAQGAVAASIRAGMGGSTKKRKVARPKSGKH